MRRTLSWLILTLFGAFMVLSVLPVTAQAAGGTVYVIRIDEKQTIDQGLAQIVQRGFQEAAMDPAAAAVAIVIDTPGGLIVSALDMKKEIMNAKLPTVAFVEGEALSSGALIATASEKLYVHTGSSIGAAEVRVMGSNEP
ncbi:MAG TPA: hypothetical protein VD902_21545, partial [Symbiobacteriaceae bacterium]|nr:hypothetical protein [Symbiobacteriaceae bacterium]